MAYNTKSIAKDIDGNPVSQYYNPNTDSYEPVEGVSGANKVVLYNEDGTENNKLDLNPILDNLNRLTGSVIDEETRKSNEVSRQDSENIRESQESSREDNESSRMDNESIRQGQESSRVDEEVSRDIAENIRVDRENIRVSQEDTRVANELDRQSNESIRQSSESDRASAEDSRDFNEDTRLDNELARESAEDIRVANEESRISSESNRDSSEATRVEQEDNRQVKESERQLNESTRLDNMSIVEGWIANPEQFNGKDIEYNWRGTELGIRLVGNTEYEYVDLKGETGDIENLTMQHITDALGYNPVSPTQLSDKVKTDVPINAKFTDTIDHTHTNKSTLDKFTEVDNKPFYNGEEIGGAVPNLTLNELTLGGRFKIAYNDIEDSLDIEVI